MVVAHASNRTLWNWNYLLWPDGTPMLWLLIVPYGIETDIIASLEKQPNTSNRTLWNWNVGSYRGCGSAIGPSNRTLWNWNLMLSGCAILLCNLLIVPYGIETSSRNARAKSFRYTSNRTLWNWNISMFQSLLEIAKLLIVPYGIETTILSR